MKWNKYTLKTNAESEDIIIAALAEIGIEGVESEDSVPLTPEEMKRMFVDIPPEYNIETGEALLHFYLEPDKDNEALLEAVKKELESLREFMDIGECVLQSSETEDIDWINNWKKHFHSFNVDDIYIVPSWEEVSQIKGASMILRIDPGTAFGTGMHETTQLCIRQLKKYIKPGCSVLDIGTGSGILGIVSMKLGAGKVLGTDLDPCTVSAVAENKMANKIADDCFELVLGNIINDISVKEKAGYEKYDIITANILAEVLMELAPQAIKHLKTGGIFITSGILDNKETAVKENFESTGFEISEVTRQGEWVSITARKK